MKNEPAYGVVKICCPLLGALLPTFNFATLGWRDLVGKGLGFGRSPESASKYGNKYLYL